MGTIVVYKASGNPPTFMFSAAERRAGMMDFGSKLRAAFPASPITTPVQAEAVGKSVIDQLLANPAYKLRFELKTPGLVAYVIGPPNGGGGPYTLTNSANPGDTALLNLMGRLDDKGGSVFNMNFVVPRTATNSSSWDYLTTDLNTDLNAIEAAGGPPATMAEHLQNYLISTFMFSRCR